MQIGQINTKINCLTLSRTPCYEQLELNSTHSLHHLDYAILISIFSENLNEIYILTLKKSLD